MSITPCARHHTRFTGDCYLDPERKVARTRHIIIGINHEDNTEMTRRVRVATLAKLLGLTLVAGCSSPEHDDGDRVQPEARSAPPEQQFTIADAERIGFIKGAQQIYGIIGASDGWDGTLAGDTVELYSFDDAIPEDFFRTWTEAESDSEWAGYCRVGNLVMLYRKPTTCDALRKLGAEANDSPGAFRPEERMVRS